MNSHEMALWAVIAVGSITTLVYPYFGLLILVFLYFGRPQDGRPNMEAMHVPMYFTSAVLVATLVRLGRIRPAVMTALKRMRVLFLLYVLLCLSTWNSYTSSSSAGLYEYTVLFSVCFLTLTWVTTQERLRGYLCMMIAGGLYNALQILRNPQHIVEHINNEKFVRAAIAHGNSVFGNSNYLALLMVVTLFLSVTSLAFYRRLWQRVILLGCAAALGYVFFQANSRGASFALALDVMALVLLQKRRLKAFLLVTVLVVVAAAAAPESYWDRLGSVSHYQDDSSAMQRLELWNIALKLIPEHPVLGVGPNNFMMYAPNSPHDAYLQMAAEVGIPAMLVYVMMLLLGLYAAFRTCRMTSTDGPSRNLHAASQGIFCCVLTVLVQGFTTGLAHRETVYVSVVLAFCTVHLRNSQAETVPELPEEVPEHDIFEPVTS